MKTAIVGKDRTGLWVAVDEKTNEKIGGYHDTELEAYKAANRAGYIVR